MVLKPAVPALEIVSVPAPVNVWTLYIPYVVSEPPEATINRDLPRKLFIVTVPDGWPANALTCASFMLIEAVADRPSSVLT
jgi:hypothetical protein